MQHRGFDGDYGPTVNIMRTPLGGRTYEGYGEDPFLAAQTAVGWIDGFQSQGVMADVKHYRGQQPGGPGQRFAGLTGLIGGRFWPTSTSIRASWRKSIPGVPGAVSRRTCATVMCSYNLVNGVYACANP